jgi:LmbE family N-acetylglucosaminyl deacetylase
MSRYMLTEKRPHGTSAFHLTAETEEELREVSPWHFDPEKEWGKPVERATIIYAHADDETIFAGGLMLAFPEWQWTLLRMTGNNDAAREREHERAVEMFKAEGVNIVEAHCFNGVDEWLPWIGRVHWSMALAKARGNPDVVFTHGFRGEYGHPHHTALHHIVNTLYDNVWHFFHPSGLEHEPQLLMGRVHVVPTDERKKRIMTTAYPTQWEASTTARPNSWRRSSRASRSISHDEWLRLGTRSGHVRGAARRGRGRAWLLPWRLAARLAQGVRSVAHGLR